MDWRLLTFIVCTFGFFKDLRPSEAYLTAYLTGPWKNLTTEQVNNEIYPWWTYSYLLWLVPVFLLTDYLRYKPVLIVDGIAYMVTWVLLLSAQGVPAMKLMQVTFGLATAAEIGYYSYLYAIVSKDRYIQVSSFTRAASQIGRFVAYLSAQLLLTYQILDIYQLNIYSMVSVSIAFIITCLLPRAQHSELFHAKKELDNSENKPSDSGSPSTENTDESQAICHGGLTVKTFPALAKFLLAEVKHVYATRVVLMWSIWWAFASCGSFQVANYIQNLWKVVAPHKADHHLYNGAVEAAGTLLSSISILLLGFLPVNWSKGGRSEFLMAVVCALNAVQLIVIARTDQIWVAYVLYDLFRASYQIVITIAVAQIAQHLSRERYGFVFGCNMFMALIIETVLTAIVVDKAGIGVDVRTQFAVYGGYFVVMATVFGTIATVTVFKTGCRLTGGEEHVKISDDIELEVK